MPAAATAASYPDTVERAKFSGPYLAAYTLVRGAPMLAAFTEEALHDEAVRSFARKVSLVTYQEHADVLEESPAKVTLTLTDGRKLERAKYYPTGSVQVPMSQARIEEKFTTCATHGGHAGGGAENSRDAGHARRAIVVRRLLAAAA